MGHPGKDVLLPAEGKFSAQKKSRTGDLVVIYITVSTGK